MEPIVSVKIKRDLVWPFGLLQKYTSPTFLAVSWIYHDVDSNFSGDK